MVTIIQMNSMLSLMAYGICILTKSKWATSKIARAVSAVSNNSSVGKVRDYTWNYADNWWCHFRYQTFLQYTTVATMMQAHGNETSDICYWKHCHVTNMYEGVSKSSWTELITKYILAFGIAHWEVTQRIMMAKLTRLTHNIVIQLHLVAESCTICNSCSRWLVWKLLDTPLYSSTHYLLWLFYDMKNVWNHHQWSLYNNLWTDWARKHYMAWKRKSGTIILTVSVM